MKAGKHLIQDHVLIDGLGEQIKDCLDKSWTAISSIIIYRFSENQHSENWLKWVREHPAAVGSMMVSDVLAAWFSEGWKTLDSAFSGNTRVSPSDESL